MNNSTASGATIAQLNKTLDALLAKRGRRVFYCHPDVLPRLFAAATHFDDEQRRQESLFGMMPSHRPPVIEQTDEHAYLVGGLPLRTSDLLPKYAKKWEPPSIATS